MLLLNFTSPSPPSPSSPSLFFIFSLPLFSRSLAPSLFYSLCCCSVARHHCTVAHHLFSLTTVAVAIPILIPHLLDILSALLFFLDHTAGGLIARTLPHTHARTQQYHFNALRSMYVQLLFLSSISTCLISVASFIALSLSLSLHPFPTTATTQPHRFPLSSPPLSRALSPCLSLSPPHALHCS